MTDSSYVYISEAYSNEKQIERTVHTSWEGAKEDIEMMTMGYNPDRIDITKERLYLGEDDEFHVTR